ncbi:MAG: serine/threonine-protein phosphatase [Phycisphaerales bacterium]|nr:serine/threonine-protein phosphatase [Phycisphaerales bacterium]
MATPPHLGTEKSQHMSENTPEQASRTPNAGELAFTLGCLPLAVIGLVFELRTEADSALLVRILVLANWIVVGSLATIAFFQALKRTKPGQAGFMANVTFGGIAFVTALTATVLSFIPNTTLQSSSSWPWMLAVLAGLAALTLGTAPFRLLLAMFPGVVIWMVGVLWGNTAGPDEIIDRIMGSVLALGLALAPAAAISVCRYWAVSYLRERDFLQTRINAFGGELDRARQVHDSMFPEPLDGDVRLEYTYDPLLGIGGDFLHVHTDEATGNVTATILDVSGHGLAAALTVNRLYGELERICAENPDSVRPGLLMSGLNRYVHLVMADHSLYATAASIQIDPVACTLRWAVAGHPPPLLRKRNGDVVDLDCTSVLLGALPSELFDPAPQTIDLQIGDVVVAYTDGTFESRNEHGEFFGIDRLRETMRFDTPPRDWSRFVANAVEQFRGKYRGTAVEDDLLVFSVSLGSRRRVVKINPPASAEKTPPTQATEPSAAGSPSPAEDQSPPQ